MTEHDRACAEASIFFPDAVGIKPVRHRFTLALALSLPVWAPIVSLIVWVVL
jgi:hypothetical protein